MLLGCCYLHVLQCWNFGPEKKNLAPPPPPRRHPHGALSPSRASSSEPPRLPLFSIKTGPPATSSDASSLSPALEKKKNKKYPKRPPSFAVFRMHAPSVRERFRYLCETLQVKAQLLPLGPLGLHNQDPNGHLQESPGPPGPKSPKSL